MIKTIAVIGGGTMGHGIAECFAMYGYDVYVYEYNEKIRNAIIGCVQDELGVLAQEALIKPEQVGEIIKRIHVTDSLKIAGEKADYVVEAVAENLELKQNLFMELDKICPEHTIFSSNTSSLKISDICQKLSQNRKAKSMVTHWYNPAHIMPIAELTYFGDTSEETFKAVAKLYESVDKRVVKVLKDIPGLIANRIQQGVAREVFSLIEMGAAEPEDIDNALKFGPAFRYCSTGQLEIADFGGLDIWAVVADNLLPHMDNGTSANSILRTKVQEGKLGHKAGEGFYKYEADKSDEIKRQYTKKLITQLKTSKSYV